MEIFNLNLSDINPDHIFLFVSLYIGPETILPSTSAIAAVIGTLFVFLYIGPETILPLTSAIAAVIGTLLICWRFVAKYVKRLINSFIQRYHIVFRK